MDIPTVIESLVMLHMNVDLLSIIDLAKLYLMVTIMLATNMVTKLEIVGQKYKFPNLQLNWQLLIKGRDSLMSHVQYVKTMNI